MIQAFPKPGQVRRVPKFLNDDGVYRFPDSREVCDLKSKKGRDEYERRKDLMHQRQKGLCCLYGICPTCPGKLRRAEAMFEHQDGRGGGGGKRDDRIEKMVDGKMVPINGVAHAICNSWKGSRRLAYAIDAP